ncbi:hypothetical protein ACQ86N_06180 [Puia sp. P3]|uniref:hypothetical protein n=1 Tax=Puia sp. P3 TaxID=3423952 RepID=UPI003D67B279
MKISYYSVWRLRAGLAEAARSVCVVMVSRAIARMSTIGSANIQALMDTLKA